jgi:hypothetical protein
LVCPGIQFKSVESYSLCSDADLGDIGPYFGVKAVSIHAQEEGSVAKADESRRKPIFACRDLAGTRAGHATRIGKGRALSNVQAAEMVGVTQHHHKKL